MSKGCCERLGGYIPLVMQPLIVAVVAARNRRAMTLRFVRLFEALDYPRRRLVVVDHGEDSTAQAVRREHPHVTVLRASGDPYWAGATNVGVRFALEQTEADYVWTVNDDATFGADVLTRLVGVAVEGGGDGRRIVGPRQMNADDPGRVVSLGSSCVFRGYDLLRLNGQGRVWSEMEGATPRVLPVDAMPGNGVLWPRGVFEDVGWFDEDRLPHYHADSDLVMRARAAGYEAVIATDAVVWDHVRGGMVPGSLREAMFGERSDRRLASLRVLLRRHGPASPWARGRLLAWQYVPFLLPGGVRERVRAWRRRRRGEKVSQSLT